jgi:hypothetical protein
MILAIAALLMVGCGPTELPQTASNVAAAGGTISSQQAGQIVNEYLRVKAKDPSSAMDLRVGEPQLWHQWGREEWIIPFWVNLKNSFGAYIRVLTTFSA